MPVAPWQSPQADGAVRRATPPRRRRSSHRDAELRRRDCGALCTLGPRPCRLAAQPEDLYPRNILSFDRPPGHWHSAGGSRRGAAVTVSLKAPPLPPPIPRRIAVRSAGYMRYYKLPRPAASALRNPPPRPLAIPGRSSRPLAATRRS